MITKLIEGEIDTEIARFKESIYTDGKDFAICLSIGDLVQADPLLIRIHSHCVSSHVFFFTGCDCREQMRKSQERIAAIGRGLIIWLDQEGRSNGHLAKLLADGWKAQGLSQPDAYVAAGFKPDNRDYSIAVKIVRSFRPRSIHLLTQNQLKVAAFKQLQVNVTTEGI